MRRSHLFGALIASTLLVAACSSTSDESAETTAAPATTEASGTETTEAGGDVPQGSTVGITDTEISIAYVDSDTEALQEAGLAPKTGNPYAQFQMFVDEANAAGGAGGLQMKVTRASVPAGGSATDQQPGCVIATEDANAAIAVMLGGLQPEVVLCITETNERLGYGLFGVHEASMFEKSEGRFISQGITLERLMASWVQLTDAQGLLEGKTLGIIRADQPNHEVAATLVVDALTAAGYEVTEEIALPCEGRICNQNEVAAQKFLDSGVDTIFSLLGALPYPTFVGAADAVGLDPQWLSSDFEAQVFNSSAKFMESVGAAYDGAVGVTYGLDNTGPDDFGADCNDRYAAATGNVFTFGTDGDAWNSVRTQCRAVMNLVNALNYAKDTYGVINYATIMLGMEAQDPTNDLVKGSWSATKHDAADTVTLEQWSPGCVCWTEIEGARTDLK